MVLVGIGTGQHLTSPLNPPRRLSLTRVDSVDDTMTDIEVLTNKMYTDASSNANPALFTQAIILYSLQIRVFDDPATGSMWKQSVKDIDGDVLCVSQFTLFANTHKGNKPDFHRAMVSRLRCPKMASRTSHVT